MERAVILERPTMLMRVNYTALVTVMLRGIRVPAGFERDLVFFSFGFLTSFHMHKLQHQMGGRM
jgi:hypothetical protein